MSIMPGSANKTDAHIDRHFCLRTPQKMLGNRVLQLFRAFFDRFLSFWTALFIVLRHRPAICHCHEPDSWLIGVLAKKLIGSLVVTDIHEIYETRASILPRLMRKPVRKTLRYLMRRLSRETDLVIHVSDSRARIHEYFLCPSMTINHFPDVERFRVTDDDPLLRELTYNFRDQIVLIQAGPLRMPYAAHEILEAVMLARAKVPNLLFVVLGGAIKLDEDTADLLEDLISRGSIQLVPRVPFSSVIRYLNVADIGSALVLPVDLNYQYAVPRKLFEYLAAGLPVIGSDVPDIRRTLETHRCGLIVDTQNSDSIASAIVRLSNDCKLRNKYALNAETAAKETLNWESEAGKLREAYSLLRTGSFIPNRNNSSLR